MNIVQCRNLHFFDNEMYPKCPHCGADVLIKQEHVKSERRRDKREKKSASFAPKPTGAEPKPAGNVWNGGKDPTEVLKKQDVPVSGQINGAEAARADVTLDFWKTGHAAPDQTPAPVQTPIQIPVPKEEPVASLQDVVKKASANEEGKTMSYFSMAASVREGEQSTAVSADPVVGWLVCVGGAHFGQSFTIAAGKNAIGRSEENKIVLAHDGSVSRVKHAFITYEPKKRSFYLQPGDASGLTYLNDEYIEESKKLQAKDLIELGDSKLLFIPLCGEDFSWEEYLQ